MLHRDNVRTRGPSYLRLSRSGLKNVMWRAVTAESPLSRTTTAFKDIRVALAHIYRCTVVLQLLLLLAALRAERSSGGPIRDDQRTLLSVQVQRQTLPGEPAVPTHSSQSAFSPAPLFSVSMLVLKHSSQSAISPDTFFSVSMLVLKHSSQSAISPDTYFSVSHQF